MEPEAELGLKLVFDNIQTHFKENFACVLVNTKIKLMTKRARKIHNKGHGTYVLRWVNDAWKVVHTQSTRKRVN